MLDSLYSTRLLDELVGSLAQHRNLTALPLSEFEQLNVGVLVRHRRTNTGKPLFVALPPFADDLATGLRAAVAAAWLAGHEAPVGTGNPTALKPGEFVFHDEDVWQVQRAPDAAGQVALLRIKDPRTRRIRLSECRKLVSKFEYEGLFNPHKQGLAGSLYLQYATEWLPKLLSGTRQAQRLFRMLDKDALPRAEGGHTILLVPKELRYNQFAEAVLTALPGAPVCWEKRDYHKGNANLPFAASIHVVDSLEDALALRKRKPGIAKWHLLVVGRTAIGNSLRVAQLAHAYEQGHWASMAFWGPDLGVGETPDCVVWPWSQAEVRGSQASANQVQLTAAPLPAPASSEACFADAVGQIRTLLASLADPGLLGALPVKLPVVWSLLHRCLRYALPPGKVSLVARKYLGELQQKIHACLTDYEFAEPFFAAGYSWPRIQEVAQQLTQAFNTLVESLDKHSPKYELLQELATDAYESGQLALIVADRETFAATKATWQGVAGVDVVPLLSGTNSLRHRLRQPQMLVETEVLVPFLFNRDQLSLLQMVPGPVKVVLLEDVEAGLYERTLNSQRLQALAQLRASGRTAVLGKDYQQLLPEATTVTGASGGRVAEPAHAAPPSASEQLDYFAELYNIGDTRYATERRRSRASGQLYWLWFADGYHTELDGHTRLLRREQLGPDDREPVWVPTQVDQLKTSDEVLLYENSRRELLMDILRQHDATGLIKRIEAASAVWQNALRQVASCYRHTQNLYSALQRKGGLDVGLQTLQAYLEGRRRFPGDPTTLPAIQKLAEHHELLQCRLLAPEALAEVRYCRGKYQQLATALGRDLSDEVLRYHLSGTHGPLLSRLDSDLRELVLQSAVERVVKEVRPK